MKKKILFIIWSFSFGGGAEKQLAGLVNNLNSEKYEIDIIEFYHTNLNLEKVNSNIHILHPINDKCKDSFVKRKITNYLTYLFPAFVRNKYIKKDYDFEVSFNNLIPTFLLSNNKKSKKICFIHGSVYYLKNINNFFWRILQKKHLKKANKIIAISMGTKKSIDYVFPEFNDKVMIINNGYNFEIMDEKANSNTGIIDNVHVFKMLYCNRFDENKNPLFLIKICKVLKERNIKFHLYMLGAGELRNKMELEICSLGLTDYVSVVGYVSNPYPYIKKSDIICLTSKSEGFSTFLIEGLHFGKPFVSTTGSVPEEIQNSGCGYISDDVNDYAEYIIKLIKDKKQYKIMAKKCLMESSKYSIDLQIKKFEKLLEEEM